jgi:hypothetical protein
MITAEAPRFPSAPGGNAALKRDLEQLGLQHVETEGRYGAPENSFIVHGPTREQMFALGKKYGQEAVIHSQGGNHEFIYTGGPHEGGSHPSTGTYDAWNEGDTLPEDYYTKVPGHGAIRFHFDFDKIDKKRPLDTSQYHPVGQQQPQVTKHEIGHKLYLALKKAYEVASDTRTDGPEVNQDPKATPSFCFLPHPHAYDWHDGHTDHHFIGHASGGVLISRNMKKAEEGGKPSLADGGSYHQHSLPFGTLGEPVDLTHYDYRGKQDLANKLIADHGYQAHYVGGPHGRADYGSRNYNTKNLALPHSPLHEDGGATDAYRKVHELAHALTHEAVNKLYGEGRRQGKLGHHRNLREALRAVHWEHLAAHKQRELNRALGIEVPDEVFNRELNTVMSDAVHRAVHGKHEEPTAKGFRPHSHQVPLETSLGLVREAARNLGLQGDSDLIRKSEGAFAVAEQKKELSIPETLQALHKGLSERVNSFAQEALKLRKRESEALEKKSPPGRKEEVEKLKAKGLPASEAFGIAWKQHNEHGKPTKKNSTDPGLYDNPGAATPNGGAPMAMSAKKMTKDSMSGMDPMADTGGSANLSMSESKMCKGTPMCKCASCYKIEKYAKGEMPPAKGGKLLPAAEGNDGTDTEKGKGLKKAALPGAAPKAPGAAPPAAVPGAASAGAKPMGAAPKLPAAPKPAAAAPKPPAMGAGSAPTVKSELKKTGISPRDVAADQAKRPAAAASAGSLMDSMLAAPKPAAKPVTLPMTSPAPQLAGVGQPVAKPAQGVQTMAERVASKMPTPAQATAGLKLPGAHLFGGPPPTEAPMGAPKPSFNTFKPEAASVARQQAAVTKKSEYGLALSELGHCAMCKNAEHAGPCA